MTEEQKELVIQNIKDGVMCGMDNWWEVFVNANRMISHGPYEEIPEKEKEQLEAWFALFMEAHAGLIQDGQEDYTVDMFYDMISRKWTNRADEVEAVKALIKKCKDNEVFIPEVVNCQKYGY